MGLLKRYLDWYWRNGQTVARKIHRFSDAIAGLLFLLLIPLGLSAAERWMDVSIPVIPPANEAVIVLLVTVGTLFALFVFLETIAGILAWTFGVLHRIFIR